MELPCPRGTKRCARHHRPRRCLFRTFRTTCESVCAVPHAPPAGRVSQRGSGLSLFHLDVHERLRARRRLSGLFVVPCRVEFDPHAKKGKATQPHAQQACNCPDNIHAFVGGLAGLLAATFLLLASRLWTTPASLAPTVCTHPRPSAPYLEIQYRNGEGGCGSVSAVPSDYFPAHTTHTRLAGSTTASGIASSHVA